MALADPSKPTTSSDAVLTAQGVSRRFGEGDTAVDALRDVDVDDRAREAHRGDGAVGLGQVHADAHPRRARPADRRHR